MKTWDTRPLAPSQQFGYWREVLCEAFTALDSRPQALRSFGSTVTLQEVGAVNAVELKSFAQDVLRGPAEIRRRGDSYFFLNLHLAGHSAIEQDGRQIEVTPGSYYLVDTTRPYQLHFAEDFHALSLRIPHELLQPLLPNPRKATARRIDATAGVGSLVADQLRGLTRCATDLPAVTATSLCATLIELVALSVRPAALSPATAREQTRRAFRQSIVRYVETRTADPALCVAAVAACFRVSPRTVHEVFAEQGRTFAQTVLERRLLAAADALRVPGASVSAVALACGFGDLSYFGRAFRRRHGCTPREWREAQRR